MAHIPPGVIHATYNPHEEPLVFLAILSPAKLGDVESSVPDPQDVSSEEPWVSVRQGLVQCKMLKP